MPSASRSPTHSLGPVIHILTVITVMYVAALFVDPNSEVVNVLLTLVRLYAASIRSSCRACGMLDVGKQRQSRRSSGRRTAKDR
jgi:hypothetical protein